MSLKEYDAGSGTPSDTAHDAGAIAPSTSYGAIALDLIVTSATNPRTSHNRAKLEQLLSERDTVATVRRLLADFTQSHREELAKLLGSDKLAGFVHSIYVQGVNQPILLRPLPASRLADTQPAHTGAPRPDYELVAGERRYFGSRLAGRDSIPAMVKAMTDQEALEFQLVENLQRDDLHPMEEAEGYERLCRDTGIQKEDIGSKIGKSRSYVYGRLKLLDLCQEGRQAFYDDKIDASRALLIARIPDAKLQIKALAEVTQEWRVVSVRQFQQWLQDNVMLRLDRAVFKITSATLLPAAGSCRECPKRTGAAPELFADVDSADICTDPKCFHKKEDAHRAEIRAKAEEKGQTVIDGKEAKALRPHSWNNEITGYLDLDEPLPGEDKSLRKVLGKDAPAPTVFIDPHTNKARNVLPADVAGKLLKEKGLNVQVRRQAGETPAQKAKREEEAERVREKCFVEEEWRRRAMREISASIRQGKPNSFSGPVLRALATLMLTSLDANVDEATVLEAWGLPAIEGKDQWKADQERRQALERHAQAAPDTDLGCMVLQLLMASELDVSPYELAHGQAEAPFIQQLASEAGVDVAALQKQVKAERREAVKQKIEKAAKKAPGATLPAARAKGESEGSAAAAPAAAAKKPRAKPAPPSIEEVKSGIADAMQNVDSASATGFVVGQRIRFKQDLKGAGGKLRKVSGREGTIAQAIGDRAFSVKFGEKAHEVATADYTELEAVEAGSAS